MPETNGSTVPQKTTAMTPISRRFCSTKALSRETVGAGRLVLASELERNASSAIEKTRHTNRNPKNQGPMALTANVWTDGTTPLLTMKVPNTTSRKARITSEKFHALRRPRRSCTCDECR